MSELKAKHVVDVYDTYSSNPYNESQVYLKSEADKEIAELKKERDWLAKDRAQAYDDLEKRAQLNIKQEESIRHHKHKRCLANADSCAFRAVVANMENRRFPTPKNSWRMILYPKWHKRWLAIAEKFKEAK